MSLISNFIDEKAIDMEEPLTTNSPMAILSSDATFLVTGSEEDWMVVDWVNTRDSLSLAVYVPEVRYILIEVDSVYRCE